MKSKLLVWSLVAALALSWVSMAAANAQDSQARLVIINYVGQQMTFSLDATIYTVPGTDTMPGGGQLTLALAPGRHTYSAQIPGGPGTNGDLELSAGQVQTLAAHLERSGPVVSPTGVVLEEPRDILIIADASQPRAATPAPQMAPLQPLPAGRGALVLINYIGEELIVDIGGVLYKVPANDRLQVTLPPGEVRYSASAGVSGINGTAQVRSGAYTGLGFTREIGPEEPDYDLGKPVPTPVPLKMSVRPVPLDEAIDAQAAAPPAPAVPVPTEQSVAVPAGQGQLYVVNYIGETLTFTINNQAYAVAGNGGKQALNLVPGEYTFTAATPGAATNGSLRVSLGIATRVSVTLDLPSGQIKAYIE